MLTGTHLEAHHSSNLGNGEVNGQKRIASIFRVGRAKINGSEIALEIRAGEPNLILEVGYGDLLEGFFVEWAILPGVESMLEGIGIAGLASATSGEGGGWRFWGEASLSASLRGQVSLALTAGMVSRSALLRGLVSRSALLRGLVSRSALLRGLVSRSALLRGLVSRSALLRGLTPLSALLRGLTPRSALLRGLRRFAFTTGLVGTGGHWSDLSVVELTA